MAIVAVFDFDQTLCDTSSLKPSRDARDWAACRERGAALPFRPGVRDALRRLAEDGATLGIATTSPGDAYAAPFLRRLGIPTAFLLDYFAARDLPKPPGAGRRAGIKAAQLREVRRRYPDGRVVFVGDDADDAEGARIADVAFVHACFGGACAGIGGTHAGTAGELARAVAAAAR
ncbi:MAG: HAD family hydrolase [Candidatus Eremiobacteraeota bacterium]|nr:HAD family hydrolase [Candidatus Eremiobacteraeota bacterium]